MSVYVDTPSHYSGPGFFAGKRSCHMYADTPEELHAIAARLGLRREWFQDDARLPHYDLVEPQRAQAVELGAVEVAKRHTAETIRRRRRLA